MKTRYRIALAAGMTAVLVAALVPASSLNRFGSNLVRQLGGAPAPAVVFEEISWNDLIPKEWDPQAQFKSKNAAKLLDSSPEAESLMREMRSVWDNAPTVGAMNGRTVRLPGYLVPIEATAGKLNEFLLVPYFGACIHTPPPPANQIVHVVTDRPVDGFGAMSAVWVSGTLSTGRSKSDMGASGYQLALESIKAYEPPQSTASPAPPTSPAAPASPTSPTSPTTP
jgi:hypothetical protein